MEIKPKTVLCPTCEKPVAWSPQNPWRPFCSERCKLIDFGGWVDEQHRISGDTQPSTDNDDDV